MSNYVITYQEGTEWKAKDRGDAKAMLRVFPDANWLLRNKFGLFLVLANETSIRIVDKLVPSLKLDHKVHLEDILTKSK